MALHARCILLSLYTHFAHVVHCRSHCLHVSISFLYCYLSLAIVRCVLCCFQFLTKTFSTPLVDLLLRSRQDCSLCHCLFSCCARYPYGLFETSSQMVISVHLPSLGWLYLLPWPTLCFLVALFARNLGPRAFRPQQIKICISG